jgi:hypothetical protein
MAKKKRSKKLVSLTAKEHRSVDRGTLTEWQLRPSKKADIGNRDCMVSFIPNGRQTYIWIGDERDCYFTVSSIPAMREWAKRLLAALPKD